MKRRKLERDREIHTFTPEEQQKFPRRIRIFTDFFGFQTLPSRSRRNITIMYSMKTRKLERERCIHSSSLENDNKSFYGRHESSQISLVFGLSKRQKKSHNDVLNEEEKA